MFQGGRGNCLLLDSDSGLASTLLQQYLLNSIKFIKYLLFNKRNIKTKNPLFQCLNSFWLNSEHVDCQANFDQNFIFFYWILCKMPIIIGSPFGWFLRESDCDGQMAFLEKEFVDSAFLDSWDLAQTESCHGIFR